MLLKYFYKIAFLFICLLLSNCTSVDKFNTQIAQPIPVEKLQKDINYTQRKLEKYYPNLYGYISKEKLNAKFDSIRAVVKQPMTSKEFYFVISPVIASVKQGHMGMMPAIKRIDKKEQKRIKKAGDGPLSQFGYEYENGKLFVIKNKSKKEKIAVGTEVISVNQITPQSINKKYNKSITSDGFNTTFLGKYFSKRYVSFMTNEIGINDSLSFTFKYKDSLFTKTIGRSKAKSKTVIDSKKKTNDTAKAVAKSKVEKSKLKKEEKEKWIFGYDEATKEYAKSLKFVSDDKSTAVLRITNFSKGNYKKAYKSLFDSINKSNIKNLVIDIRDNPGGRLAEVVNLYSYLTDKPYTVLLPATVTSKTSLWKTGIFKQIPKVVYPFAGIVYPFYMATSYIKTKKNTDGTYRYNLSGSKPEKPSTNNFKGKIYVLINGGSFSASCILSSTLKTNPNVTFVGEETGGAFNGTVAGLMPVVQLPVSKISLRLGLMDIRPLNQSGQYGRGIFPDKEIVQTIQDKMNNKDPEMDWILEDIKNTKR